MEMKKSNAVAARKTKAAAARAPKKQKAAQNKKSTAREKHEVRARRGTCECGKVTTDEPLELCETCAVCNERMHTVHDKRHHEQLHAEREHPAETEPVPKRTVRRSRTRAEISEEIHRTAEVYAASVNGAAPRWETFFMCQRYPVLRGQLITTIMAGKPLEVARINKHMLLDVVLLATACREQCNAEIVDDFQRLLDRTEEEWRKPDWTCKVFSQLHADWANNIINHGTRHFESFEAWYVPTLAQWLLEHDVPNYFSYELTEEDPTPAAGAKRRRGRVSR